MPGCRMMDERSGKRKITVLRLSPRNALQSWIDILQI
jgi:hypothetical protein